MNTSAVKALRHITIHKSDYTQDYISSDPMFYDFHLLFLLLDEEKVDINHWSNFCKSSSIPCWTTAKVFINKIGKKIELFDIHDLIDNENLTLPKSPKFVMTTKNFMQFMHQLKVLQAQRPEKIYIAIDQHNIVHATTDLASIQTVPFFASLRSKIFNFFTLK